MEKTVLNLKCSPGTFAKLSSDVAYRTTAAQEAMAIEGEYDEVIFTPYDTDGTTDSAFELETSSCSSDLDPKKTLWLESSTKYLISRVKELRPKVGKTAGLKNKKLMWKKIAEELCVQGHNFNGQQVEAKFFSLERQFKKTALHNSKTGRNRQTCPFQSELDELLQDRKSLNPEFVLSSVTEVSDDVLTSESELPTCSKRTRTEDVLTSPESEFPTCSKRRRTAVEEFMEKAEERAMRREESDKILRESFLESLKKKEERAARKEAEGKEKMELLRKLVENTKKLNDK